MWSHCQDGTRGFAENLLCNRPQKEFLEVRFPAGAHNDQVNVLGPDQVFDSLPNFPFPEPRPVRNGSHHSRQAF
jgi:hypothetical protein